MSVILYRRHTARCVTKDPASPERRLSYKAKRLFMGCDCPLWVGGRVNGVEVERQSCRTTDLAEARRMIAGISGAVLPPAPDRGPTLAECITRYMERRENELGDRAREAYRITFDRLQEFARANNISLVRDLSVEFLERFKFEGIPVMADSSRSLYFAKVRQFLFTAERLGWIEARIADRTTPHQFEPSTTLPFSDEEVNSILEHATGLDRLVIELMLETGLRVSDAVQFEPGKLIKGEHLWIYPFRVTKRKKISTKRSSQFEVFVTEGLKSRIEAATDWRSPRRPFFCERHFVMSNTMHVRREMYELGKRASVADCRPHRLRDTFAVRKLLAGVSIGDVSRLLGHSTVLVTEQSYAAWIPSRARRLEGIAAASLVIRPSDIDGNAK